MLSVPMVLFGKRRRATSSSLKLASERGGALLTLKKEFLHCTALLLFVVLSLFFVLSFSLCANFCFSFYPDEAWLCILLSQGKQFISRCFG